MENNTAIKFGTDGWRGVISDNFTFSNVRRVAKAIADYYNEKIGRPESRPPKIVVGYDTRFLSGSYAEVVSNVLVEEGITVQLSDRATPTPTLSFAVRHRKFDAGVMITASHNPAEYNGIKIKTASGGAAGVDITSVVEQYILKPLPAHSGERGTSRTVDLTGDYVKFLRSYIDLKKLKNARFKVLVDAMHGSGDSFIAEVLKGTSVRLEFLRNDINPSFGGLRPEPVVENLGPTIARMKKERFDVGLILDGDADRIAAMVGSGVFVSPQQILGLLALHLYEDRHMGGGIVKTIVGSDLMDNITSELKLKLYETPVGFKYISNLMQSEDILVGGEEAGGMGFKGYIPERDGTLAGILLLEMMAYRKKSMNRILEEMQKRYGRYYYLRDDLRIPNLQIDYNALKSIKEVLGKEVVEVKDYDGVKLICRDGSWLMFRGSGTEPIMRLYAESKNLSTTKKMLAFGKDLIVK